ncbi:MAG: threonine--tRNA ligase [Calditrichaeota bacterium]|nr:MAG: threonine--tRNA ligase [Calditrichota bacterium]
MDGKIRIKFPDGSEKEYPAGITGNDILKELKNHKLRKQALAVKFNDRVLELWRPLEEDGEIKFLTFEDPEGREVFWHSSAHLMAQAIKRKWPQAKLGIGPPIENGFYYDIELDRPITPEEFAELEAEMARIVEEDYPITRKVLSRDEAVKLFRERHEDLKIELINDFSDEETITAYSQGEFIDLCRGPHVPSTGKLGKHFKLLSVAGAYWRGDEKNQMLQRIYGTNYPKREMLEEHLRRIEEAKKRDHRRLGKQLDLFSIQESIGNGLILWHPKGARIRRIMEDFWVQEHYRHGYELVYTPHTAKLDLWDRSGHTGFYRENMFPPMELEGVNYQLKPMNCPFHLTIYKNQLRSYRDLPIRYAEFGTVYRYERSGVLHGLMRVRGFTQDDAHIFCTPEQLTEEIVKVLDLVLHILGTFGFREYEVFLSTRPEKYVGTLENWERATGALKKALEIRQLPFEIDPGEGVFYGPKIDIKIKDVLGRSWQCSTVQVDFNLPERFELEYVGEDGNRHRPIMVHRALFGSMERFFGILIEHYGGNFPLWLAPVQVRVLPIAERHHEYAREVYAQLREAGIRVELDDRNEKVGYKIREAEVQKVPYMLILGDREAESGQVAVRHHGEGDKGAMPLNAFVEMVQEEVRSRRIG